MLARIRKELAREPIVSDVDLARRVGVSRATLTYYRRHLRPDAHEPAARPPDVSAVAPMSHAELVARVTRATDEVWSEIARLRAQEATSPVASVIFRGYATLERHHRLLAELIGEVGPVEQNVLIGQLQVLLREPVDCGTLSPAARASFGERTRRD